MKTLCLILLTLAVNLFAANPVVLLPPVDVSCTTSGVLLVAADMSRRYLLIVNKGANTVYVAPDAAPTGTAGTPIVTLGNYEPNGVAPVNAMYCKSSSGTMTVTVQAGR